jgi:hypothetical protein
MDIGKKSTLPRPKPPLRGILRKPGAPRGPRKDMHWNEEMLEVKHEYDGPEVASSDEKPMRAYGTRKCHGHSQILFDNHPSNLKDYEIGRPHIAGFKIEFLKRFMAVRAYNWRETIRVGSGKADYMSEEMLDHGLFNWFGLQEVYGNEDYVVPLYDDNLISQSRIMTRDNIGNWALDNFQPMAEWYDAVTKVKNHEPPAFDRELSVRWIQVNGDFVPEKARFWKKEPMPRPEYIVN